MGLSTHYRSPAPVELTVCDTHADSGGTDQCSRPGPWLQGAAAPGGTGHGETGHGRVCGTPFSEVTPKTTEGAFCRSTAPPQDGQGPQWGRGGDLLCGTAHTTANAAGREPPKMLTLDVLSLLFGVSCTAGFQGTVPTAASPLTTATSGGSPNHRVGNP